MPNCSLENAMMFLVLIPWSGIHYGLALPNSPSELLAVGAQWLSRAFWQAKTLPKDRATRRILSFHVLCIYIYIYFITWIYSVSHDILRYGSKICQTPRSCVVLGVPKPNVSYSIIVPLEAINPGIYHIFVSNAKWTKQCYLHSFWSPKKHVQGPAKHARKTYRKCWRFLPLPVFNTDKQETCCFVRNGSVIRKKNET